MTTNLSQKFKNSVLEQNAAAGGQDRRKIYIKSGDLVTVSLELSPKTNGYKVSMRFKSGGCYRKVIGDVITGNRSQALLEGLKMLRKSDIIEKHGWKWYAT